MKTIFANPSGSTFSALGKNGLEKYLAENGRMPPVSIVVKPLSGGPVIFIDKFLSYSFTSSILIPVDTFSLSFAAPDGPALTKVINDGDIIVLQANDVTLSTGIIDSTEIEIDREYGEKATIAGRDTMGQLEDQDAVSLQSKPIYAKSISIENGVKLICQDSKITKFDFRNLPNTPKLPLLASEPSESKLSVLQRFIEPYNIVAWSGPDGELIVGKPNMRQIKKGNIIISAKERYSNVLSARVRRQSTNIANMIAVIWAGQEEVTSRVGPQQIVDNAAPGPTRLRKANYIVAKTVVTSNINATDPQGLAQINAITQAGGSQVLQAAGKREIARQNVNEIIFECVVPGHYNANGEPWMTDTVYNISFDRGDLSEHMYLYQVQYQLSLEGGQTTVLSFCRLGSIVADNLAP
jgi:prophage tail gpP-like protein